MTIKWRPDGTVDRDAMRVTPTGEYADALDEAVKALRECAKQEDAHGSIPIAQVALRRIGVID